MNNPDHIVSDEPWRYADPQERAFMADTGIHVVLAADTITPMQASLPVERDLQYFQRSFQKVINPDGTVTDGNGNPWKSILKG